MIQPMSRTPETIEFDPAPCAFPRPHVPPLPNDLSCIGFGHPRSRPIDRRERFRDYSRGRYALHEAYRLAGVGPGSALLAPAYHCRTMIDPALALGGEAQLYPLAADLRFDLAAIDQVHRNSPTPVKALLATHFFGFPVPMAELARWCAERGITLVEDCSHVMFGPRYQPPGTGTAGRFVVSSPYKFITSPDGGLLYSRDGDAAASPQRRSRPLRDELRAAFQVLSALRGKRRLPGGDRGALIEQATDTAIHPGVDIRRAAGCSIDYRAEETGLPSLRVSRQLHEHADLQCIADARRKRYRQWTTGVANLPDCRSLFPDLADTCVPYMFPLLIDRPDTHFHWLKRLGVPIWRWDSIVASDCPTANRYRLHLLHLPCHQSIDDEAMDWMIDTIRRVLARRSDGRST